MVLFDKRFVYFMWDDELEGKKVFASNDIYSLMDFVNYRRETDGLVKDYGYSNCPFITVKGNRLYQFVYYDPNYEVKRAFYKEGKQIQVAYKGTNNWVDCDEPEWVDGCQFRVKPECPCDEGIDSKACAGCPQDEARKQTFRPFKNCDELVEFWSKNYQTGFRPANTKPLIWVKKKKGESVCLITAFDNCTGYWKGCVFFEDVWIDLKELFDDFEFLDGSPCGMEVEE